MGTTDKLSLYLLLEAIKHKSPPPFFFKPLCEVFMGKKKKSKSKRRSHVCIHIQTSHNFQVDENDLRIPRNAGSSKLSAQF